MLRLRADFWDVKFYPYTEAGVDPVFAVVGNKHVSSLASVACFLLR